MAGDTIKIWHFNTEAAYKDALSLGKISILDLCFIKDKAMIITNGTTYCSNV